MTAVQEDAADLAAPAVRATELVRAEAPALFAYFQRRVEVAEDAADLVSETLVVIWRRIDALPPDPLEARMWLFGVARRVLSTYRRGRRRHHALAERLRAELAGSSPSAGSAHPDLADALTALRARDRELILLVHQDGFTLAEVARLLGGRPATIRSRYQRARARLRSELAR